MAMEEELLKFVLEEEVLGSQYSQDKILKKLTPGLSGGWMVSQ